MPSESVLESFHRLLAEGHSPTVNGRHPELDTWPAGHSGWSVTHYCREEVRRQGHDLTVYNDGGARVEWMLEAWAWARERAALGHLPSVADIEHLGRVVETGKNAEGFRSCVVRVGARLCPPPGEVVPLLTALVGVGIGMLPPLEWYRDFEMVHPFRDGNGRVGKILLSWLADAEHRTFVCPRFPPADLWGHPILNP